MPTPVQIDQIQKDNETHDIKDKKSRAALTDTTSGTIFQFGIDSNGNYGYIKAGADTVTPFKTVGTRPTQITSNGTYTAKTDINKDGYSEVSVNVPSGGSPVLDSLAITQNTQAGQPITPPTGVDGYNSITVNVTPNVDRKVITGTAPFSQTFTASQETTPLDGYSQVQVNITGGSASTLVSKTVNIGTSQNHQTIVLDPSEESPAADGYSDVTLVVDVPAPGGSCNIRTQAQWDALTFAEKRSLGLTVIRDANNQANGVWYNMVYLIIDIIKEFFSDDSETISMQSYAQQTIPHLIYMQGRWKIGGSWDSTVINHSNLTYDSVDTGSIETNYTGFNKKLITILHDVTVGNNASITIARGYGGVTDGGGVFAIPFNSTAELIGEHFGSTADSFTTDKNYDFVLFISNKWVYGSDASNGVYTIDAGTLIQTGDERLDYVGSSDYATAVYENVPSGTTITLGNGKTGAEDSVVAIGINEITTP